MSTITQLQGMEPEGSTMETMQMRLPVQTHLTPSANTSQRRNKIKLDPLRALEPARKKLSTIEAQRVMSVLEDTKKRCEIVSLLPHVLSNLDKYSALLGPELMSQFEDHRKIFTNLSTLEDTYAELLTQKAQAAEVADQDEQGSTTSSQRNSPVQEKPASVKSDTPVDEKIQSVGANLSMTKLQLQYSIKSIMRVLSFNPGTANMLLQEAGNSKSREGSYFAQNMSELKDILMEKLLMTPIEEKEKMHYLSQVSAQERNNAAVIDKLEGELRLANDDKDHEIRLKNDIIRKLQNDLHMLEKATEEEIKRTKTEAEKQEAADNKNSEGKREKLLTELNQLSAQLQNQATEHREEEQSLRRKKWKVETEVENWIQKFDQDMGDKQDEYEEIDTTYTEEKKQLNELEERFKTLETEYKTITEARNKAKEEREAAERQMSLMIKAATTIQAVWRSYKVRKALKAKNKKGKKGKKGK